jgi:hypothetical protein
MSTGCWFPVSVGVGKRLFTDDAPPIGHTLLQSRSTSTGALSQILAPKALEVGGLAVGAAQEAVQ